MRENRTYGSEGGEPAMDNSPTPINRRQDALSDENQLILSKPSPYASSLHCRAFIARYSCHYSTIRR
jgi:hypothetical protein